MKLFDILLLIVLASLGVNIGCRCVGTAESALGPGVPVHDDWAFWAQVALAVLASITLAIRQWLARRGVEVIAEVVDGEEKVAGE